MLQLVPFKHRGKRNVRKFKIEPSHCWFPFWKSIHSPGSIRRFLNTQFNGFFLLVFTKLLLHRLHNASNAKLFYQYFNTAFSNYLGAGEAWRNVNENLIRLLNALHCCSVNIKCEIKYCFRVIIHVVIYVVFKSKFLHLLNNLLNFLFWKIILF